jgi:hypothetical protein
VFVPQSGAAIKNLLAARDGLYLRELDGGIGHLIRVSYSGGAAEEIRLFWFLTAVFCDKFSCFSCVSPILRRNGS